MPLLAQQPISRAGLSPSYSAAVASTTVLTGDRAFLHVKNAAGAPMTVTVTSTATQDGQPVADLVVTVPATNGDKMIGPLIPRLFASLADGVSASITYSSTTSVTVASLVI
ncbi:hypothetical protein [Actinacidiphila glaucinigra]|uniref:hypothetical protein n=1 Tax=Actinacidiphila glaucinigra TaxID=235986 RepID=UPI0035DB5344